jgi:hypothetical protein
VPEFCPHCLIKFLFSMSNYRWHLSYCHNPALTCVVFLGPQTNLWFMTHHV